MSDCLAVRSLRSCICDPKICTRIAQHRKVCIRNKLVLEPVIRSFRRIISLQIIPGLIYYNHYYNKNDNIDDDDNNSNNNSKFISQMRALMRNGSTSNVAELLTLGQSCESLIVSLLSAECFLIFAQCLNRESAFHTRHSITVHLQSNICS